MAMMGMSARLAAGGLLLGLLAACADEATPKPAPIPVQTPVAQYRNAQGPAGPDDHVPDFATRGFAPFARQNAVAIALREWRLFGQPVDDDDPEQRPDASTTAVKPERLPGLWERVGEYWWIGQDPYESEVAWTGKHDANGTPFDFVHDGRFAWSAAFISYVMRIAGASERFPYSPNHSTYINAAVSGTAAALRAQDPANYAPQLGDLICAGRGHARSLRFADLPTSNGFPAHCGIVVARTANSINIIGGNVDDAVTLTHVPVGPTGLLFGPDGHSLDSRYPWLVVLQVLYDADAESPTQD
ncbi:DUF2272 domain-containing protein [Acetobacteraceae bacterium KSS8]|uniref:DUF2272 domain-containing protein n=1 Tax=Endosaccharibacter trunci TaxID=2812733 RepID=A0ABT1WCY0_9PROT|nr:DUF2272 domain-containing protein [Acetobacteraceae bacterium KSS8]